MAPFEGLHRPLGYEALFAVKLALQERNAGEGVAGYRLELIALNDFDDPAEAAAQARELALDPAVRGVIGHLSAETTAAALPVYRAADLAVAVPWSVSSGLARPGSGVVFVAATLEEAEAQLRAGLDLTDPARLSQLAPATPDRLAAAGGLLLDVDAVSAGEWVRRLGGAGRSITIGGLPEAGSQQFVEVAGPFAAGVVFAAPGPAAADLTQATDFVAAYTQLAGFPPGPRAALAYDAAQLLLDSLEQTTLSDANAPRHAVAANLSRTQREGVTGPLAFDEAGLRLRAPVWLYQIEQDRYPGRRLAP